MECLLGSIGRQPARSDLRLGAMEVPHPAGKSDGTGRGVIMSAGGVLGKSAFARSIDRRSEGWQRNFEFVSGHLWLLPGPLSRGFRGFRRRLVLNAKPVPN